MNAGQIRFMTFGVTFATERDFVNQIEWRQGINGRPNSMAARCSQPRMPEPLQCRLHSWGWWLHAHLGAIVGADLRGSECRLLAPPVETHGTHPH